MDFFNRYKKTIIAIASLLCLCLIFITADRTAPTFVETGVSYLITPFQKANTAISKWIENKINIIKHLDEVEDENEKLAKKVLSLEEETNRLKQMEKENKKLTELLKISQKYKQYPTTGARIIAKDPGNWYDVFIIDKGTKDGIQRNMVVLSSNGLVGKISEAGYNYSKVVSIIDDTDSVSSQNTRTEDIGFVRGDLTNKGICIMEYIDNDAEIIEGDEIITSHLSNIYPPGLTIGYVKEIYSDLNTLTKYAVVEPIVDFKNLETVLVITQNFEKNISFDMKQENTELKTFDVETTSNANN